MKFLKFFIISFLLVVSPAYSSIGIGVTPSMLNLDFSSKVKYVVEFKFFNEGDEDAEFVVKLPSGLKVSCDWCNKSFLVRNHTYYDSGYVTGTMTFYPSPNGDYVITVEAKPLSFEGILAVMPSVGIKVYVSGYSSSTTTTTTTTSSSYEFPSPPGTTTTTTTLITEYQPPSKQPSTVSENIINESSEEVEEGFSIVSWLVHNLNWIVILSGLIIFAVWYYKTEVAPPI